MGKSKFFVSGFLVMFLLGCSGKPTVTLFKGSWESIWIANAIAEFIITRGYGYPVEIYYNTEPVMRHSFESEKIDVILEMWHQNNYDWYKAQKKKGSMITLGKIYSASPQYWMIPKWVAEKYSIDTVFDLKDHWKLFVDHEHPFKGVFYNCIIGWGCDKLNIIKLKAYGLYKYFDVITPASAYVLESALVRAQKAGKPVFGYSWTPGPTSLDAFEWHILKEPPYSSRSWDTIYRAVGDENLLSQVEACAYEDSPLDKVVHRNMLKKAPDLVEMLGKMFVEIELMKQLETWTEKNCSEEWEKTAIYFLKNFEKSWKPWVSKDAYHKIKESLSKITLHEI
jgi:glycine betaine/proline transport system substrate-binding protein